MVLSYSGEAVVEPESPTIEVFQESKLPGIATVTVIVVELCPTVVIVGCAGSNHKIQLRKYT